MKTAAIMKRLNYLLALLTISITIGVESKSVVRRNADPLVRPRVMQSSSRIAFNKLINKGLTGKEKCKVMPLKARSHIKANTIFTGTVISFYNRNNRLLKQGDLLYFRKGNAE